jgi:hypothetical protein
MNKKLIELLKDIKGQSLEMQYKMIEAYVNCEVQRIVFKEKNVRQNR